MTLTPATDILFTSEPDPDELREIAARAFDVSPSAVTVGPLLKRTPDSGTRVILQRQPEDARGDFPVWYGIAVEQSLVDRVGAALDVIARDLGLVALSDADDDESMTLHLPDGSDHVVSMEPGHDEAFRTTPEIRQLILHAEKAISRRRTGHAVAN